MHDRLTENKETCEKKGSDTMVNELEENCQQNGYKGIMGQREEKEKKKKKDKKTLIEAKKKLQGK